MVVYLLVAILIKQPFVGQTIVNVQTMVFKDSARCLRNAEANKKRLQNEYDRVEINCMERKLEQ